MALCPVGWVQPVCFHPNPCTQMDAVSEAAVAYHEVSVIQDQAYFNLCTTLLTINKLPTQQLLLCHPQAHPAHPGPCPEMAWLPPSCSNNNTIFLARDQHVSLALGVREAEEPRKYILTFYLTISKLICSVWTFCSVGSPMEGVDIRRPTLVSLALPEPHPGAWSSCAHTGRWPGA